MRPCNFAHGARTEADFATAPLPIIDSVDDTLASSRGPSSAAGVGGDLERVGAGLGGLGRVRNLPSDGDGVKADTDNLT